MSNRDNSGGNVTADADVFLSSDFFDSDNSALNTSPTHMTRRLASATPRSGSVTPPPRRQQPPATPSSSSSNIGNNPLFAAHNNPLLLSPSSPSALQSTSAEAHSNRKSSAIDPDDTVPVSLESKLSAASSSVDAGALVVPDAATHSNTPLRSSTDYEMEQAHIHAHNRSLLRTLATLHAQCIASLQDAWPLQSNNTHYQNLCLKYQHLLPYLEIQHGVVAQNQYNIALKQYYASNEALINTINELLENKHIVDPIFGRSSNSAPDYTVYRNLHALRSTIDPNTYKPDGSWERDLPLCLA